MQHLQVVLQLMGEHQFYVKESATIYGVACIVYLDDIISAEGVQTNPKKIQASTVLTNSIKCQAIKEFLRPNWLL